MRASCDASVNQVYNKKLSKFQSSQIYDLSTSSISFKDRLSSSDSIGARTRSLGLLFGLDSSRNENLAGRMLRLVCAQLLANPVQQLLLAFVTSLVDSIPSVNDLIGLYPSTRCLQFTHCLSLLTANHIYSSTSTRILQGRCHRLSSYENTSVREARP